MDWGWSGIRPSSLDVRSEKTTDKRPEGGEFVIVYVLLTA